MKTAKAIKEYGEKTLLQIGEEMGSDYLEPVNDRTLIKTSEQYYEYFYLNFHEDKGLFLAAATTTLLTGTFGTLDYIDQHIRTEMAETEYNEWQAGRVVGRSDPT